MTLLSLVSAKGSPGVTTLGLALAALSGAGSVLADLDPAGGDVGLRFQGPGRVPLDPRFGLLTLAASLRQQDPRGPEAAIDPLAEHLQQIDGGQDVLVGVSRPDQVVGVAPLWPQITQALRERPGLVVADCGRFGFGSPMLPVLADSDAVLVVARAELEQLAHLRELVRHLEESIGRSGRGALGVVLIAPERAAAVVADTTRLLATQGLRTTAIGHVALDVRGADVLSGKGIGRPDRSTLVRSARALLPAVHQLIMSRVDAREAGR